MLTNIFTLYNIRYNLLFNFYLYQLIKRGDTTRIKLYQHINALDATCIYGYVNIWKLSFNFVCNALSKVLRTLAWKPHLSKKKKKILQFLILYLHPLARYPEVEDKVLKTITFNSLYLKQMAFGGWKGYKFCNI